MNPKIEAILWAAFHSIWITFLAITLALLTAAVAAHATSSIPNFLAFIKSQGMTVTIVQVICPAIRSALAAKETPQ